MSCVEDRPYCYSLCTFLYSNTAYSYVCNSVYDLSVPLAAENNIKEMVGCDLLPRLVRLLGAQEKGLRAHAVMCLAAGLASCECCKEKRQH